ncbi:MAG: response regulator [Moorea sp. SIO2B7]|nr:response regulator [Moorena sp. SIO2B7]
MILNPPDLLTSLQSYQSNTSTVSTKLRQIVKRTPVILLVDDSITVRTQEKRILERAGYEVVTAVDGLDGYNKLNSRYFDAVISDVEMPNLDGFYLTAIIRQHQEYNELPIILVTSFASDEHNKKGMEAGANAYITKGKINQYFLIETLQILVL